MRSFPFILILTFLALLPEKAGAFNKFLCKCTADGPGFEETNKQTGGVDKICDYNCSCLAWEVKKVGQKEVFTKAAVPGMEVSLESLPTSAKSFENWDFGSHICHGQYSYRQSLTDPNWKIDVKFDAFTIDDEGSITYPDGASRLISSTTRFRDFKYSKKGKEVSAAILKGLNEPKKPKKKKNGNLHVNTSDRNLSLSKDKVSQSPAASTASSQ